ncbi:MAG: hypothetical protein CM1200mP36_09290 [Gammaproteobacteria bacterium]|nr:MAG: hypothetical protein CM1200mP36_09290 [Gammaproteobacteria bacterium]
MTLQQEISADRLRQKVGREIHVIIDQANENDAIGRSEGDSPEIDGKILLSDGNFPSRRYRPRARQKCWAL